MVEQCNPPCPPHLCEQWWHHGMCSLNPPKPACDGCGLDATDRCPHCLTTTCGQCRNCEHGPTLGEAP